MSFKDKILPDNLHTKSNEEIVDFLKNKVPTIFLVCFRNKNRNVVVYEAIVTNNKLTHIEGYWLLLEPSYRDQQRRTTKHDREEFSVIDQKFAWNYVHKKLDDMTFEFIFQASPEYVFQVKHNPNINHISCWSRHPKTQHEHIIKYMTVYATENWYQMNFFQLQKNIQSLYFFTQNTSTRHPDIVKVYDNWVKLI